MAEGEGGGEAYGYEGGTNLTSHSLRREAYMVRGAIVVSQPPPNFLNMTN